MTNTAWHISGHGLEVCNCAYFCPCILSNRIATPTQGDCIGVLTFQIDTGWYGEVSLDGLGFAVFIRTPGPMADGNWSLGVVIDDRATPAQQQALVAMARGEAGGPMEPVAALTRDFLGVERRPIHFRKDGLQRSVSIPERLDQAAEGVPSSVKSREPLYLDNTAHRFNPRIALAKATRNHIQAFGLKWIDDSGTNSSAFAPFTWHAD